MNYGPMSVAHPAAAFSPTWLPEQGSGHSHWLTGLDAP